MALRAATEDRAAWAEWPRYDDSERVRRIAWRKVDGYGLSDPRITADLARACADAARALYEPRRQDSSAPLAGSIEPPPVLPPEPMVGNPPHRRSKRR
jgi:hypothetical protein